ncbi:SH3 domain-containing protein [Sulfurospirillum sp. T05]|uniref:SH3 domain-containing protein n=1 Tax=Sulfurospirillum tamanense TaxID=2813362 RepID=A0ABS2WRS8_9BACT|nr:SH3 domain-containing protein [Sulfurospirillum tamanensis]MBN2964354.1 SH3 domain-containing protein [Sulfurospirillum tamanensis]
MRILLVVFLGVFLGGCSLLSPPVFTPPSYAHALPKLMQDVVPTSNQGTWYQEAFFMPWTQKGLDITAEDATWPWRVYLPFKGYYGETKQPRTQAWFDTLREEANIEALGSLNQNAITLENSALRNFPTHLPLFRSFAKAGEGFPFDYNQNTRISLMTPLKLSHYSKDGGWAFVLSSSSFGWIPASAITIIDQTLQEKIQRSPKTMILQDHTPLVSTRFETYAKLGTLLPLLDQNTAFKVEKDLHVTSLYLNPEQTQPWPLPMNAQTLAHVAQTLLNEPYGWGGLFDHRDCSAMTKDFFAPFGLWLPRNSAAQKKSGTYLSLKHLSNKEKEAMITRFGKPFLTLLYLPGHIMLYAGTHENTPVVMHNVWGIKTSLLGLEGRGVIGKAIVSDLHVGANHPLVASSDLLLSRLEGMTLVSQKSPQERLANAYPDAISHITDNTVWFHDGTKLPFDDGEEKDAAMLLENPSIKDHFFAPYPALLPLQIPTSNPGRARNDAFFKALYGQTKEEVESRLVAVRWLPSHTNQLLRFHGDHGAAKALQAVSDALDALPPELISYVDNPAGTHNYRTIAKTNRLSAHSYGIAIDINTQKGDYWQWSKTGAYRNQIPEIIVHIFEKHGFVWGGRWKHFDTFHFEYRPELVNP